MFDLTTETRLTATQACHHRLLSRGDRPLNRSVLERWWTLGIRPTQGGDRVVLESFRHGGLRFTTVQAIERFLARLNGAPADAPTPQQLHREHVRADAELAASGI